MKKIIEHYPMTDRLIATQGYGSWVNNSSGTVALMVLGQFSGPQISEN